VGKMLETIIIEKDIKVYYVTANSFPEDILTAHQTLHSKIPFSKERRYFGLSRPEKENDGIVYKAAAEQIQDDLEKNYQLDTFVIEKGTYKCITISNYKGDPQSIKKAFQELTALANIDSNGYCLEWYCNKEDVSCMVKITG
jgi:predicted transcriptional regulator YdeE